MISTQPYRRLFALIALFFQRRTGGVMLHYVTARVV